MPRLRFLFRRPGAVGRPVVGGERAMPRDDGGGEAGGLGGLRRGEISLLPGIGVEVVELWGGTVVGAEEFPATVPYREIGEFFVAGESRAVGGTTKKERSAARSFGSAE